MRQLALTLRFMFFLSFILFTQHPLFSDEIGVACMFRNFGPYVNEWMEYHIMIGVDHFWLYDDLSQDQSKELLKPYVERGIVELLPWNDGNSDWVPRQIGAYQDALRKANGRVAWLAMIDSDEFLFPTKDASLKECMKNHFSSFSGVYANWRNFGTSHKTIPEGKPLLNTLLYCSQKYHPRNGCGKSIVRPNCVDINSMLSPHFCPLSPQGRWSNGEGKPTLQYDKTDLKTDGQNHEGFLRINHYAFRDEKYFRNYRLPRDSNPTLILEQYEQFNKVENKEILRFIQKNYPKQYKAFWKHES